MSETPIWDALWAERVTDYEQVQADARAATDESERVRA